MLFTNYLSRLFIATLPSTIIASDLKNSEDFFPPSHNESLLWGPYRPNLYFGLRPRIPDSLLTSLMWTRVEDYERIQSSFRHTCEQNEIGAGYGWSRYDPRKGGVMEVKDSGNGIDLTVGFVKDKKNWAVRVSAKARPGEENVKTTVVWSLASQAQLGAIDVQVQGDGKGATGDVVFTGNDPSLGSYKMVITEGTGRKPDVTHPAGEERPLDRTFVSSSTIPKEHTWQSKSALFKALSDSFQGFIETYGQEHPPPPELFYTLQHQPDGGNHQLVQKTWEGDWEFDIIYTTNDDDKDYDESHLSTEKLKDLLDEAVQSFDDKFEKRLKPQQPFTAKKYTNLSKSLFSNLLGGIGFFHGDQKIDRSYASEYDEDNEGFWNEVAEARGKVQAILEGPSSLFTATPSRAFFPRGFLWDEGFHLIPMMDFDIDLVLDIVRSWFSLIDEDGWIPREVILGDEARTKVPEEFQVQYPHFANPPTLFLVIEDFVSRLEAGLQPSPSSSLLDKAKGLAYLRSIYPLLKSHYNWFRKTQSADHNTYDRSAPSPKDLFRWRGRTPTHCLPSGLDDYPRAQPPHPGELHVDAISWVGLMANSLQRIAEFLEEKSDAAKFKKQEQGIKDNAAATFYDQSTGVWCDVTIDEFEEEKKVCRVGYISLMPWLVGLVDNDDKKVGKVLDVIRDENGLWSKSGVRSLSKQDEEYGTGENYWKSPIWMNINYMILNRLLATSTKTGPYREKAKNLYIELRENLVNTVSNSWEKTGYAWEQYNPETSEGQRTQHFLGWTSLVVKIMAMPDLSSYKHDEL